MATVNLRELAACAIRTGEPEVADVCAFRRDQSPADSTVAVTLAAMAPAHVQATCDCDDGAMYVDLVAAQDEVRDLQEQLAEAERADEARTEENDHLSGTVSMLADDAKWVKADVELVTDRLHDAMAAIERHMWLEQVDAGTRAMLETVLDAIADGLNTGQDVTERLRDMSTHAEW